MLRTFTKSVRTPAVRYLACRSIIRCHASIATERPQPSPAFNQNVDITSPAATTQTPTSRDNNGPFPGPALDDSMVGMSGGEVFHEMMLRKGVKHVFGYPGGAILPVFDALYQSKNFDFILPRHEQGAGHMAEGYAKASGLPGVVVVTSGPGATNVITPMQDALSDGVPLVVFCGQVPTSAIGSDAFQEADTVGISRSCTKWNVMVKNVAELPRRINEAFEIATSGRPGPVLVDLPKDVTASILRHAVPTEAVGLPPVNAAAATPYHISHDFQQAALERTAQLIKMAKRPVIYAGAGMLATEEGPFRLKELADKAQIPVTTTLQGLGSFDELDEKSLHMLGMHGSCYANLAIQNADLILALGARFDDRVTLNISKFAPEAKKAAAEGRGGIVHFEISPKNINKVVQATEAIEGDVSQSLAMLLPLVEKVDASQRKEWMDQIKAWKQKYPFSYDPETPGGKVKPQTVIHEMAKQLGETGKDVVIATGVGQHQMWVAQLFPFRKPRTIITSGGLGTMGFGLPAAIGAKVARPDAIVIDVDGDASFCMTSVELAAARQFNIGVKIIILNNEEQGMVTQWQNLFYEKRYSHTHQLNPDFVKLAEANGIKGLRASTAQDIGPAIKEWLATDGPVLLEVMVDSKVPVLPMVPSGKGLDEFLFHNAEKAEEEFEA